MTHALDQTTADTVFAAARTARFTATNLGQMATVPVDGYDYRVIVTPAYRAYTDCRGGWGATEYTFASATPAQDRAIRAALALQAAPATTPHSRPHTPRRSAP
ncbi:MULTISPECIES: hypothetical protein [Streptomyces]|uniref:Uncharacterized protein n=1 Tax=Streptomyces stelliscabiei TaxID=146820 RepID=A0A8I0TTM5_9ACTN|nr:hypothetical protein [Streptomyces stelliscabiei]KND28618.1 hypothetical protein IQ64_43580 [Streptomyces stelliscabiei]MBE1599899.1 hypothetical protein [Streptomyces stelliscabiei]